MTHYISLDAESNGLGGQAFAVAAVLSGPDGEISGSLYRCPIQGEVDSWVAANVLPVVERIPQTHDCYEQMLVSLRRDFATWTAKWVPKPLFVAHVAWPVEARLLLDMYPGNQVWDGPFPLIDVAAVLYSKGHDPVSVDSYLTAQGVDLPQGSPHNPLYDARAAVACLRHLMGETK